MHLCALLPELHAVEEGGSPSDTALTQAGEGVPSSGSTEWSQLGQSPAVQTHGDSL